MQNINVKLKFSLSLILIFIDLFNREKILIFLYFYILLFTLVYTEFSLEISRTITGGTTIQREVTENVVHLRSRVSINHIYRKNKELSTRHFIMF